MMPAGETASDPSGWTSDLLFIHLQTQLDGLSKLIQAQFTAEREFFLVQHADLISKLDERYATQTKALDAAFVASEKAMTTARTGDKEAIQAALLAAKEAVEKANTANEKRFENVNEFRGQLADMQSTLISRVEAESRFIGLDEKTNARSSSAEEAIRRIQSTIDKGFTNTDTRSLMVNQYWGYLVGVIGLIIAIVVPIVTR